MREMDYKSAKCPYTWQKSIDNAYFEGKSRNCASTAILEAENSHFWPFFFMPRLAIAMSTIGKWFATALRLRVAVFEAEGCTHRPISLLMYNRVVWCSHAEARASRASTNCNCDAIKARTGVVLSVCGLLSGDFNPVLHQSWGASSPKNAGAWWLLVDANGTRNGALNRELQLAEYFCRFGDLTLIDAQWSQELRGS